VLEFQNYMELLEDSMVRLMMAVDEVDSERLAKALARVANALRGTSLREDHEAEIPDSVNSSKAHFPAVISKQP
jgi:hypothetical protein